jgi:hypothetical protein
MKKKNEIKWFVLLSMMLFLLFTGCSNKNNQGADAGGLPQGQGTNFADDIKDITLPPELVWDRKESMVIKTESFRGGIFIYKGRVESMSLKDYMIASMRDNKWRLVGESASKDIMLAFIKPNKTCMMIISDGFFGKIELKLHVAIDKTSGAKANNSNDMSF